MSIEEFIKSLSIEDIEKIRELKLKESGERPIYSFSKIDFKKLKSLFQIKRDFNNKVFEEWFSFNYELLDPEKEFLKNLIERNIYLVDSYKEEDLKINFIAPLLTKVDYFLIDKEIRSYYEESIRYETSKFILNGTTDFLVSKGLEYSEQPLFFIQEFKKSLKSDDPRPQLISELIAGVELNNWNSIKGVYIIGENWNFVILRKEVIGEKISYKYHISRTFNSTNIEDLKNIYIYLLSVKEEIKSYVDQPYRDH